MGLARVYVLLALVVVSVAAHSLSVCSEARLREGYTASEGRALADKKLSQNNASDLRDLQEQVSNLEPLIQQIHELTTDADGHAARIKQMSKQARGIGSGKQVAQVSVSGSNSSDIQSKYQ